MDSMLKQLLGEANKAYVEGRFDEAETLYVKARGIIRNNPVILERLGSLALWKNNTVDAEHYLTEAKKAMPWYEKTWPFTATVNYRLAMTCYRRDSFAEASRYFNEAAGPLSLGPFKELKAMGRHAALLAGDATYVIDGPEESRLPFVVTDPLPVVKVPVNSEEPALFIIDNGGAEVILDRAFAKKTGAEMAGAFSAAYAGQKKAETGTGKINSLQVGDFVVRNVPVHTLDTRAMSPVFDGLPIDGIIGTRLLMHFLATIDYAGGALVLRRRTPAKRQSFEAQSRAEGARVIPFWLVDMHMMVASGTVNGCGPTLLFVDTGLAGSGFTASEADLTSYGIHPDWTKAVESTGGGGQCRSTEITVEKLTLGTGADEVAQRGLKGAAIENSVSVLGNALGFHIGGLVSHAFFRKSALTMDFDGMRLFVK